MKQNRINWECRSVQEFASQLPEGMNKRKKTEMIDMYFMKGSLKRKLGLGSNLPEYRRKGLPEIPEDPGITTKIDYRAESVSEFLGNLPEELTDEERKEALNIYKAMTRNRKNIGAVTVEIR